MTTSQDQLDSARGREPATAHVRDSDYDAIALSAYFIALDRARHGEESDPLSDWLQAEREIGLAFSSNDEQQLPPEDLQ